MLVSITPKMFTWSGKFRRENCDIPFPQELDPYYPPVWLQLQESQPFITLKGGGPGNIQNLSSKPDQYHTIYISLSPSSDHLRSLKLTPNTKLISLSHLIPILNSNSTPPQPKHSPNPRCSSSINRNHKHNSKSYFTITIIPVLRWPLSTSNLKRYVTFQA